MKTTSSFVTPLRFECNDDNTRTLIEPFVYEMGWLGSGVPIPVEAGFRFDGASIPRFLHWYMHPFDARIVKAACLHDKLYKQGISRLMADIVLFESMGVLRASLLDRVLVLLAVRLGGWPAYARHRREGAASDVDAVEVIKEADAAAAETALLASGEPDV
ncbi:MAG: DUF1353 domain-containing protein [Gammaproteobacteria bacterium]